MATKPITLPRGWADNAVYTTGPFIGQPGKVAASVGVAAEGHRPGAAFPTAAEHENYQQNRLTDWVRSWLFFGDFNGTPDAHIVETNASGRAGLWGLDVNDGADETAVTFTGVNTVLPTVLGTCTTGAAVFQADVGGSAGVGFSGATNAGNATVFSGFMNNSPGSARVYYASANAGTTGTCLVIEHAGTGNGARVTHSGLPGSNGALYVSATSGNTRAVVAQASGNAPAVRGQSGIGAGALAFEAFLFSNEGTGFYCQTPVGSLTTARAFRAEARGSARAVEATAVSGDAISANATGSGGAALYLPGRATNPTNTFNCRIDWNTTSKTLVVADQDAAGYRDVWTSVGGLVIGAGTVSSVISNGAWVTAATLTLTGTDAPRRGSRPMVLEFVCEARNMNGNVGGVNVRIFDVTDDPVVAKATRSGIGTLTTSCFALPVATTSWQRNIVWRYQYTVPAAGDRTFRVEVQTATADSIQVRDCVLTPYGLF